MNDVPAAPLPGVSSTGFSRRTVFWVAAIAVVSFAVAIILMAYGPELGETPTAGPSVFSYSALGHRGLYDFLGESGIPVKIRRSTRLFAGGPDTPILVAEPEASRLDVDLKDYLGALIEEASGRSAPLVLVLPKWSGKPRRTPRGLWVEKATLKPRSTVEEVLTGSDHGALRRLKLERYVTPGVVRRVALACKTSWGGPLTAACVWPQLLKPSASLQPVVWSRDGVLVARVKSWIEGQRLYIVSDPDILSNHGLARKDNALIALRLLKEELKARAVVIDEVIHGHVRELSFLAELLRFPLVLAVAHIVLVLALVLWAGMGRFGKPIPPPPRFRSGKLALIDNTADLLSFRGRAVNSLLRYFNELLLAVAREYRLSGELSREETLDRLQEISDDRGIDIRLRGLREEIAGLAGAGRCTAEDVTRKAMALHRWQGEITDGH